MKYAKTEVLDKYSEGSLEMRVQNTGELIEVAQAAVERNLGAGAVMVFTSPTIGGKSLARMGQSLYEVTIDMNGVAQSTKLEDAVESGYVATAEALDEAVLQLASGEPVDCKRLHWLSEMVAAHPLVTDARVVDALDEAVSDGEWFGSYKERSADVRKAVHGRIGVTERLARLVSVAEGDEGAARNGVQRVHEIAESVANQCGSLLIADESLDAFRRSLVQEMVRVAGVAEAALTVAEGKTLVSLNNLYVGRLEAAALSAEFLKEKANV